MTLKKHKQKNYKKYLKRVLKILLLTVLLLENPGMVLSQEILTDENITLQKTLELASQYSPRLASVKLLAEGKNLDLVSARRNRWPVLDVEGYYLVDNEQEKRLIMRAELNGLEREELFNSQILAVEPTLRLPIYTGGLINGKVDMAQAEAEIANTVTTMTKDQLLFNVTSEYLKLLEINEAIRATQASILSLRKTSDNIEKRIRVGKAVPVDFLRIRTRESDLQVQLLRWENDYQKKMLEISTLVGLWIPETVQIADTINFEFDPVDQQAIREVTINQNPKIQISRLQWEQAAAMKRITRSWYLPKVSFKFQYGWYYGNDVSKGVSDYFSMINFAVPILDMSQYKRIQASSVIIEAQEKNVMQTKMDIDSEIQSALVIFPK